MTVTLTLTHSSPTGAPGSRNTGVPQPVREDVPGTQRHPHGARAGDTSHAEARA